MKLFQEKRQTILILLQNRILIVHIKIVSIQDQLALQNQIHILKLVLIIMLMQIKMISGKSSIDIEMKEKTY